MNVTDEHDRVLVRGGQTHDTVIRSLVAHDARHLAHIQYDRGSARVVVAPLGGQVGAALAFHDFLDLRSALTHRLPHGSNRRTVHIRGMEAS